MTQQEKETIAELLTDFKWKGLSLEKTIEGLSLISRSESMPDQPIHSPGGFHQAYKAILNRSPIPVQPDFVLMTVQGILLKVLLKKLEPGDVCVMTSGDILVQSSQHENFIDFNIWAVESQIIIDLASYVYQVTCSRGFALNTSGNRILTINGCEYYKAERV